VEENSTKIFEALEKLDQSAQVSMSTNEQVTALRRQLKDLWATFDDLKTE
jgi:hypothetical protein